MVGSRRATATTPRRKPLCWTDHIWFGELVVKLHRAISITLAVVSKVAFAQTPPGGPPLVYPVKPVRIVIPFAKTKAERTANNDPRLSLEERYTDHAGYVAAVRKAAASALQQKFLLQQDADALIAAADASAVLK